jgi:DNA helicase-2/ATP-dependent DNA helicase PcrA
VAAPRDRERVVMKASRFLEELPPSEPELFERWQLDDPGAGSPTLTAAPALASLPGIREARVIPVLFGKPPDDPADDTAAPERRRGGEGEDGDGGDDVPF